ncbi:MAG: hypothetical protein PHU46_13870 [Rhodocyclaceae bacterium]|nr:hypothetical protein [Rhodocyclaceae bacterium]
MRNEIALSDQEIEARFEEIGAGAAIAQITFTRETFSDWLSSRQHWPERGRIPRSPPGTLVIEQARPIPELPHMSIYLVDFGTVRGLYTY